MINAKIKREKSWKRPEAPPSPPKKPALHRREDEWFTMSVGFSLETTKAWRYNEATYLKFQ